MHLAEALALRSLPARGLFLSLTRRCPLHCDHCSTRSTMRSEQLAAEPFLRLASSFTADDRPEILSLTGGEPLLRPRLVRQLTELAHDRGSRVELLTGGFFASAERVSPAIRRAIEPLDHLAVSMDRFHEREVPRRAVLALLREQLESGKQVSVQLTGAHPGDPYLDEAVEDVRGMLNDRCPIYVAVLGPVGRASEWLAHPRHVVPADASPCRLASWPVVAFDGTVVACCNQAAIDGPVPPHLRLGHAADDSWSVIRRRALQSPMLRAIRTFGPVWMAQEHDARRCDGYCETCLALPADGFEGRMAEQMKRRATAVAELAAMLGRPSPEEWIGIPRFAHLVKLGLQQPVPA